MFAFVLMPFDSSFDDIYKIGIKETCDGLGIRAERVDEQLFYKENILERIYNQIIASDFIIADMTGRNPNVFYEVGFAHAKGKLCLLLTANADDIPFDLKHQRHIVYGNSIQNLRRAIEEELIALKSEVDNRQSAIIVSLKNIDGFLEKTDYYASANVSIFFDFHNKTTFPSPEFESMYFYTGSGWSFKQDGQDCLSTDSDLLEFARRHYIRPPLRRLHAGGWAQLKLDGQRILAFKANDQPLQDKYRVAGRSLIRIATSEGLHDYPLQLNVVVDEIPF